MRRGHVYVLPDGQFVKVGKSVEPSQRLDTFRTANVGIETYYRVLQCRSDAESLRIESAAHKALTARGLHQKREWFDCDPAVAWDAVRKAEIEVIGRRRLYPVWRFRELWRFHSTWLRDGVESLVSLAVLFWALFGLSMFLMVAFGMVDVSR